MNGPTLCTNITQRVRCPNQFRILLIDQVLESPEQTATVQGLAQTAAGRSVADALSEVGHVLKPQLGRKRIDEREIQLVDLDGVLSIDSPVSLVQNATCPVRRSTNQRCSKSV